jgi:hypothetical protein
MIKNTHFFFPTTHFSGYTIFIRQTGAARLDKKFFLPSAVNGAPAVVLNNAASSIS